jgi:hypothetical protein
MPSRQTFLRVDLDTAAAADRMSSRLTCHSRLSHNTINDTSSHVRPLLFIKPPVRERIPRHDVIEKQRGSFTARVDTEETLWYAVVMNQRKIHPLPWRHQTDGKRMSAVIDAEGKIVCGSLICQQSDPDKTRETHAFIVKAVGKMRKEGM